jgi:hypothetical protein
VLAVGIQERRRPGLHCLGDPIPGNLAQQRVQRVSFLDVWP